MRSLGGLRECDECARARRVEFYSKRGGRLSHTCLDCEIGDTPPADARLAAAMESIAESMTSLSQSVGTIDPEWMAVYMTRAINALESLSRSARTR